MTSTLKSAVYQGIEEISSEDCAGIAQRKMKTKDLDVENVTMKTLSDTPVGFGGDHYRLKITIRLGNNPDLETDSESIDLHFFVKTKPRGSAHCDFIERMGVVKRELDFFSIIMPRLQKYVSPNEEDQNVPIQTPWTPNCYLSNMKLIVLDDLTHEDYRLLENRTVMDYEHCVVMIETLARFHASSFIFEEKESQRLGKPYRFNEEFPDLFKENTWTYDPPGNSGRQICEAGITAVFALIKIIPQLKQNPDKYEKAYAAVAKLFEDINGLVAASTEFRNVATHGDLWANNIMFRYDSIGSKPEAARLVDFQLLRYTAPAHDLICALYLNLRREFRDKHFLDLALVYHTTVAAELAKHDLDVEAVMPWSEFQSSLAHYRWLGILTACAFFPAILMPEKIATDVFGDPVKLNKFMVEDQSDVARLSFETDDLYRERVSEIVMEMVEYVSKK